ncbi:MAG: TIGR00730 family Rossman fold protein [Candidatus Azobacteroides sp.]|nr:TIGR00730 family Rossman fold protein [Candidatus Azobacteroides sp.]
MTITIYAASSSRIAPVYFEAAKELGKLLAQHRITCVNGGGHSGLMACVTDAVLEQGGKVTGIIPQFMVDRGWCHPSLSERIITEGMHMRKQWMAEKSDACIALPGGVGTLEELLEIITWKQLGLYTNPIIILNINHFYDNLLRMLEEIREWNFMPSGQPSPWQVAETPQEALQKIC